MLLIAIGKQNEKAAGACQLPVMFLSRSCAGVKGLVLGLKVPGSEGGRGVEKSSPAALSWGRGGLPVLHQPRKAPLRLQVTGACAAEQVGVWQGSQELWP